MNKKIIENLYFWGEIIIHYFPFISRLYIKFHEPSVKKEIEMVGLLKKNKILHIGCGTIPYTSIIIAGLIQAELVCIDYNSKVIDLAFNFINKLHLNNNIKFEVCDGCNFDVSDFDVIIISYSVLNKDLVLHNVVSSIKDGGKIILRMHITTKNQYIDTIIQKYSIRRLKLLLTQESILISKDGNF